MAICRLHLGAFISDYLSCFSLWFKELTTVEPQFANFLYMFFSEENAATEIPVPNYFYLLPMLLVKLSISSLTLLSNSTILLSATLRRPAQLEDFPCYLDLQLHSGRLYCLLWGIGPV